LNAFRGRAMLVDVVDMKIRPPFRLWVRFSDGAEGEIDHGSSLLSRSGPMIEPLKDPAYFRRGFVEDGAPTWPNGYDISPEALYEDMLAAGCLSFPKDAA
jgi:hypothetical protein